MDRFFAKVGLHCSKYGFADERRPGFPVISQPVRQQIVEGAALAPALKPDWRRMRYRGDDRSAREITEHFILERDLAAQLKNASAESRSQLYNQLYDELFAKLPSHPRHRQRHDDDHAEKQVAILRRLVPKDAVFLEIGAGDCRVSLMMAQHCRATIALDVAEPIDIQSEPPPNFQFRLTDGILIPLESVAVDFVYSNQLMEHLHPRDAPPQLQEINRVLRPGGCYFCITPTKLTGPHDISRFFHDEPLGFHLKEYTYQEIANLLNDAGFCRIRACIARGRHYAGSTPVSALILAEFFFGCLPAAVRQRLNKNPWLRALLGLTVLAYKPA